MYDAADTRYCYPGTNVLDNKAGHRDQIDLDKFETFSVERRSAIPLPPGRFSATHFRAIHRHLFQDVYSWAGQYRKVGISKGGNPFCQPEYIDAEMRRLFEELAGQNYFRDLEPVAFAENAAHFLTTLNAIHPFREGNGRTQNLFLAMLADQASHPLDFDKVDAAALLSAMISSFYGDESLLVNVIQASMRTSQSPAPTLG